MPPQRKTRMSMKEKKRKQMIALFTIVSLSLVGVILWFGWATGWTYNIERLAPFGEEEEAPEGATFVLYSRIDGEDVSWVEISLHIPKESEDTSTWDLHDIYDSANYEEEKSSMDAEDVVFDLTGIQYAWIEIDPDAETVFQTTWIPIFGGVNREYQIYVDDPVTDVHGTMVYTDNYTVVTATSGTALSGEYTIIFDCPHNTTTASQLHVGTNWDIEQSEYDDMKASELKKVHDEKYWAGLAPKYVLSDDTENEYIDEIEQLTEGFAIELDFNTSISLTDGENTQVNCTLDDNTEPIEIIKASDKIYLVFYSPIDFESGAYSFIIEASTADNILLDSVKAGWLKLPADHNVIGTYTALETFIA